MPRGAAKLQQRSAQRLAQANREASYHQDCSEVKKTVDANLQQCGKAPDPKECCQRLCDCATSRERHAAVAFSNGVLGSLRMYPAEDPPHYHFRNMARGACSACLGMLDTWRLGRRAAVDPPTPSAARTPVRRTILKTPAASGGSSFRILQASPASLTSTPASEQHSIARLLGMVDLSKDGVQGTPESFEGVRKRLW